MVRATAAFQSGGVNVPAATAACRVAARMGHKVMACRCDDETEYLKMMVCQCVVAIIVLRAI
jgi:hypothetical protein